MTPARLHHRVEVLDPHAHLFDVTLQIEQPPREVQVSLPVWIPGSYLVREFSQHLQGLQARAGRRTLPCVQTAKNRWTIKVPEGCERLTLRHQVHAFDASVRTAYLDARRGFFNPTSLCLRVWDLDRQPHTLEVVENDHTVGWSLATALRPLRVLRNGFGRYLAEDYDELADNPVEMGRFWSGSFRVRGVSHRFVVSGAGASFDGDRLLRDTQRLCEAHMRFWHGADAPPPFDRYLFLLHATHAGYGGLEHRHATALICQHSDLPRRPETATEVEASAGEGYTTLLGLISHEYFHAWNVKRLRPDALARIDYERENHTPLLWFFEGFTSYYDDLLLRRAGLIDTATYLKLLAKGINQVLQTPGRQVQSLAQASYDAWTRYYRVQENTPNATVSYYTKGAMVALCLDLRLRQAGRGTLDDLMRTLWKRCDGGPMREIDLKQALTEQGGAALARELHDWVHGTDDPPAAALLQAQGVQVKHEDVPLAQRLGLRVQEGPGGVWLKNVLRGGAAEAAGMAAGDEWLAVGWPPSDDAPGTNPPSETWRLQKLDELLIWRGGRDRLQAWVARDRRVLCLTLHWPPAQQALRLLPGSGPAQEAWLTGAAQPSA